MGNREDLLAGALRCLYDKGYARTTARDIATVAGVSLAAIGYHFGSKEALLNAALRQALEEWGDSLRQIVADGRDTSTGPTERFEATWDRVLESFVGSARLWAVQFELLAHLERVPELRETFTEGTRHARLALAELFDSTADAGTAVRVGSFYQALLAGLAGQWLADPASVPTGRDLLDVVRRIASGFEQRVE